MLGFFRFERKPAKRCASLPAARDPKKLSLPMLSCGRSFCPMSGSPLTVHGGALGVHRAIREHRCCRDTGSSGVGGSLCCWAWSSLVRCLFCAGREAKPWTKFCHLVIVLGGCGTHVRLWCVGSAESRACVGCSKTSGGCWVLQNIHPQLCDFPLTALAAHTCLVTDTVSLVYPFVATSSPSLSSRLLYRAHTARRDHPATKEKEGRTPNSTVACL